MTIADDKRYRERFIKSLQAAEGTLALSWIHLREFFNVRDAVHAANVETLLDGLMPNLFFIEPNPNVVRDRENCILERGERLSPHSDPEMAKTFLGHDDGSLNPLSVYNFFTILRAMDLDESRSQLCDVIIPQINEMQSKYRSDSSYRAGLNRPTQGKQIQHGTRFLYRDILVLLAKNHKRPFTSNDVMDLLHTVVPAAYCEYLLLDGHWEAIVNQARGRLRRNQMEFPIAKVYSARNNGLERFLVALGDEHL